MVNLTINKGARTGSAEASALEEAGGQAGVSGRWERLRERTFLEDLLRFGCFCVFLGRSWEHFRWNPPFRALFWNQGLLADWVEGWTGATWSIVVTGDALNVAIARVEHFFGFLYLAAALAVWLLTRERRWPRVFVLAGAAGLMFLAFLQSMDRDHIFAMWIEHTVQWSIPLFTVAYILARDRPRWLVPVAKVAVALTFTGHGLFALGLQPPVWLPLVGPHPMPGSWVDMTMTILPVGEDTAVAFLKLAGFLDLVVAVGLFLPGRLALPALGYAAVWGFLTALARVLAHVDLGSLVPGLDAWLHEMILRLPHAILPLYILLVFSQKNDRVRGHGDTRPAAPAACT